MQDGFNKFFHTLMHPDREDEEAEERAEVAKAANILQVGEFQLLQLAYHKWHGDDLPTALVDRLFTAYMLRNEVPHWARHYARDILTMDREGLVNSADTWYHRYDHEYVTHVPRGTQRFVFVSLLLIVLLGGGVYFSARISDPAVLLPPYFDKKEIPVPTPTGKDGIGRQSGLPS